MSTVSATSSVTALLGALDLARQGIDRGYQGFSEAAQQIASTTASGELPPVESIVAMKVFQHQVQAAAKVLERVDQGLGTLLDVHA
jgi:hypothetical protein